ncbi:hypothetical protein ALC62_02826 [Cyphomyrmex costatus]|uniref:Uncharacterized protein n=1 Tax=Cyphomyrmex costatus TaxID=456900 RepID=A0A151IN18_9HYME|nr:hypothetical protein ALC62_02826 [Cyphomyrmex costatus]
MTDGRRRVAEKEEEEAADTCVYYVPRTHVREEVAVRRHDIASRRCASMCTRGKTAASGQGQKLTHPGPTDSVL